MDKLFKNLIGERNAEIWASNWLQVLYEFPHISTDKGTMITWFSTAIETGYDLGRRDEQNRDIVEKLREIIFQAAGAATRPLLEDHPDYVFPSDRVRDAVEQICSDFGIKER